MNVETQKEQDQNNSPKVGDLYIDTITNRHYIVTARTVNEGKYKYNLRLYCLQDGYIWSSDSLFGTQPDRFSKFTGILEIRNK